MPPSIAAALLAALLTASWLLGRRRAPLLRSTDTSDVAALNRAQIALVQAGGASQPDLPPPGGAPLQSRSGRPLAAAASGLPGSPGSSLVSPAGLGSLVHGAPSAEARATVAAAGGASAYRTRLEALFRGDRAARLTAVQAAAAWGDRLCLPLLRRALRDTDPAVIRAAAQAIERFRGRSAASVRSGPQRAELPRRVARTR